MSSPQLRIYWDDQDKHDEGWAYRMYIPKEKGYDRRGMALIVWLEESGPIVDLDDLKCVLQWATKLGCKFDGSGMYGCEVESYIDFGGEQPEDLTGVIAWDESSVLYESGWTLKPRV